MNKIHPDLRAFLKGISLVVSAFLSAAIMNSLGKIAIASVPLTTILFMQNFFALVFLIPFVMMRGVKSLHTKKFGLHALRAFTGLSSFACLFFSMKSISLVDATLLGNAAPLFLPFVFWVWMGKKITPYLWGCILIGYIGVFLILNPSSQIMVSWMAVIALLSSLFSAIALQCVRNLTQTESTLKIAFYYFFMAMLAMLPFFLFEYRPYTVGEWIPFIAIGVCQGITQVLLARAYTYANPTVLGPFNYSVVVFAGLIQWWVWDLIPTKLHFIGIFLVCLGGILTIHSQKPPKPPSL